MRCQGISPLPAEYVHVFALVDLRLICKISAYLPPVEPSAVAPFVIHLVFKC